MQGRVFKDTCYNQEINFIKIKMKFVYCLCF